MTDPLKQICVLFLLGAITLFLLGCSIADHSDPGKCQPGGRYTFELNTEKCIQ